ncbi:uncharacterized protein LOC130447683 isoform X2 [Diorhabda sublineata]|uniref:uncharacterized protein LOC130447683 isoform X2 n=1 Tax=Diorhabda sublineata TaxID=1163346 RepID=UPI0024E12782|nr:uncharacterized protein LOC130447683 isoform X2 [Diorhabda sublineata]
MVSKDIHKIKNNKKMNISDRIRICEVCGKIYIKPVEFFCHFSTNHIVNQKKLHINRKITEEIIPSSTFINFKADVKEEIIEENLQESGIDSQLKHINYSNPSPDDDWMCSCSKIHNNLVKCEICSKNLKHKTIFNRQWCKRFGECRESTEDYQRPGSPATVSTPETVTKMNQIVRADRRMIAKAVIADKETVRKISHDAQLVPKNLTPDQKVMR